MPARLILALLLALPSVASAQPAAVAAFPIAGASVAIDPAGNLALDQAKRLAFEPARAFVNPGVAKPYYPLIVWVRLPYQPQWRAAPWYLEASYDVGFATLYYRPAGSDAYASQIFGMRVPFRERIVARVLPTLRIPANAGGAPLYLRLAVDEESRIVPLLRVLDESQLRAEDAAVADLASIALIFIGVFISLAATNLFVYAFIRERSYLTYSVWMLSIALFASTYLHNSAWKWLWPGLGLPELAVQATVVLIAGWFLVAFARQFLESAQFVPRFDRVVLWGCVVLTAIAVVFSFGFPSAHLGAVLNGRDVFLMAAIAFVLLVFALGVAAMLAGNRLARFFVAANLAVCISGIAVAVSNFFHHSARDHDAFLALMIGQGIEGWLLFGALAYRLRSIARDFAREQQRRIEAQAEALAQARELLEQRRLASIDALTGVGNRREFDQALAREWERCARTRAPLSLLLLDVDHFKAFNDTYGHVLGDDCLRRVAAVLAAGAGRPGDVVCRYGGEEFAAILPETDEAGAYVVAGEICQGVRGLQIPHRGSSLHYVSASIGVGTTIPQAGAPQTLTERADANLYRAKAAGRNRSASGTAIDQFAARAERVAAPPLRGIH
ncbi:MAG TPA: diguanylate cyclase [Verrucomicrobiae bacterium]|nr:diguanylate cyclase [Verrucomicrobiae bacterium]